MRSMNNPHFEKSISQRLRLIASEDDLALLRQIVADAQRGRRPGRPWYLKFVYAIVERVGADLHHTDPRHGDTSDQEITANSIDPDSSASQ
jgi:hypothetical protein